MFMMLSLSGSKKSQSYKRANFPLHEIVVEVQVVRSQPMTAHLGITSEHKMSFDGCITQTIKRIKSHLKVWAS